MKALPVITSCEGCGACCREQSSPPGYGMIASYEDLGRTAELKDGPFADDLVRWREMPAELKQGIRDYFEERVRTGDWREGQPCFWFDPETRQCRHHEWRPDICREFEVGSDSCHGWRRTYGIEPQVPDFTVGAIADPITRPPEWLFEKGESGRPRETKTRQRSARLRDHAKERRQRKEARAARQRNRRA